MHSNVKSKKCIKVSHFSRVREFLSHKFEKQKQNPHTNENEALDRFRKVTTIAAVASIYVSALLLDQCRFTNEINI